MPEDKEISVLDIDFSKKIKSTSEKEVSLMDIDFSKNPSVEIGAKGSIADRHNNPGNLMYIGQEGATRGESKQGGGYWAKFDTPEAGYNALLKDLEAKKEGNTSTNLSGDSTVSDLFMKYAPPDENDTDNYIKAVSNNLGVAPDTKIKDIDSNALAAQIAKFESGTFVLNPDNADKELKEKEFESKAHQAGLINNVKQITPETLIAKQDEIQPYVSNDGQINIDAYLAQKQIDQENARQDKIIENAEKLGLSPEFLNRVVDINKITHPVMADKQEQTEDYLLGSASSFNEGLAEVFRTLDRASTMMAESVGLEWKNPVWDMMSESLSRVGAEGQYKVPDNVVGNVMGGLAGMAPDLAITYVMPEMKLAQLGKITGGALTKIPKFPTWLGAKQGLQAYSQAGDSNEKYRDFFSGAQHGFVEGLTYEALGITGAQAGKLADALGAPKILSESISGIANGSLFGIHGTLINPEFLETGKINGKQFATDFGIGLAFHGKKIGNEIINLATVNQSMLRKAHTSYWTSNRDLIRTGFVSPKSQFELRRESQKLWDAMIKTDNPVEKNQLFMAKTAVDNIISSRAYAIMVGSNPKIFKDAIKNDKNLSGKDREYMTNKIEETAEDFKATVDEGNAGTNIAPEFNKFIDKKNQETIKNESKEANISKEKEKKLTETEIQKPEEQVVDKNKKVKSEQKSETLEDKNKQDEKLNEQQSDAGKRDDAGLQGRELQESKEGTAEKKKAGETGEKQRGEKPEESRKDEKKADEKTVKIKQDDTKNREGVSGSKPQGKATEQKEPVSGKGKEKAKTSGVLQESKKVKIDEGKIKQKDDFLKDVSDEVTNRLVKKKTGALIKKKQKQLDSEVEKIDKTLQQIDKKGISINYKDSFYKVKLKDDGTYSVSTWRYDNKLKRNTVYRVTNKTLKKEILDQYKKQREADIAETRTKQISELENKYINEIDLEIQKYIDQRSRKAPKKPTKFSKKETGETVPYNPKTKSREKLPSEGSEITISERLAKNIRISAESKAALDAMRDTNKKFGELKKAILTHIKEAVDSENITSGQYKSIINRFGSATTDLSRQKTLDYVDSVLDASEYNGQLNSALAFQQKVKKGGSKFGEINKSITEGIKNIDLKDLTVEELYEFNEGANRVFRNKNVPNLEAVADHIAQFFSRIKENNKAEKIITYGSLDKYVSEIHETLDSYKELIRRNELSAKDFVNLQRKITLAKRLRDELNKQGKLTEANILRLDELFGEMETKQRKPSGEIKDKIDALINDYVLEISEYKKENTKQINKFIVSQEKPTREIVLNVLDAKEADLKSMTIADIEAYREILSNLKSGFISPYIGTIENSIREIRGARSYAEPALNIISKSKQWNLFRERNYLPEIKSYAEKIRNLAVPKRKTPEKKAQIEKRNLRFTVMSLKPHRLGTLLGNYDKYKQLAVAHTIVTRGIQMSHALERTFDTRLMEAHSKFEKSFDTKEQRRQWLDRLGFLMVERSWQSSDKFITDNLTKENASINGFVYDIIPVSSQKKAKGDLEFKLKQSGWESFKDFVKENDAFKTVKDKNGDNIEIVDTDKLEFIIRKNKNLSSYMDEIQSIYNEFEPYAKAASIRNGFAAGSLKNFFPFYSLENKNVVSANRLENDLYSAIHASMMAGSTHERHRVLQMVNTDIKSVTQQYIREMSRNYYAAPALKEAVGTLRLGAKNIFEKLIETDKDNAFAILRLSQAVEADIMNSIDAYYGAGKYANQHTGFKNFLGVVKKAVLAKPQRIPRELSSNTYRAWRSLGGISVNELKSINEYIDLYKNMIDEYVGGRYISKWGDDVKRTIYDSTIKDKMDQGATWIVTVSDSFVGRRMFAVEFNRAMKDLSDKPFDQESYINNEKYRIENKEILDKAAFRALRKVEELFNDKTPMTNRQYATFFSGILRLDKSKSYVQLMDMLQSFNRNEAEHLSDAILKLRYAPAEQKKQALKDFHSVVVSNAIYNILRVAISAATTKWAYQAMGWETDDRTKETIEELHSGEKWWDEFMSSSIGLMWGGSANIMKAPMAIMMYAVDKSENISDDTKSIIFESLEREFYMRKMPSYGTPQMILGSIPLIPTYAVNDLFQFTNDGVATYDAVVDLLQGEKDFTKEDWIKLIATVNTGITYSMSNAFTPWINDQLKKQKRVIYEMKKYEGMSPLEIKREKEQEKMDKERD